MRLEQLEYLAAVVQHGSLRRASEQLHISQPALSEGVGKLERELGVVLLDRRRSGARISRSGRELLAHMTDVLDAADRLRAAAGDQYGAARAVLVGTVNTGTSSVVVLAVLPDFSVVDDPLYRAGLITHRPIADDTTSVSLVLLRRARPRVADSVRELHAALVRRAQEFSVAPLPLEVARSGS